MNSNTHTIDATDKSLGRVASDAAVLLMGKDTPEYAKNKVAAVKVSIINASKAAITDKKKIEKTYVRYSGYPGGLKTLNLKEAAENKGYSEIFRDAVYGMLPGNKLRQAMMKNLIVTE